MRHRMMITLVGCLILAASSFGVQLPNGDNMKSNKVKVKGRFGVEFAAGVDITGVAKGFGLFRIGVPSVDKLFDDFRVTEVSPLSPYDVGKSTPMSRIYMVEVPQDVDDARFIEAMKADPHVVRIENDVLCRVMATPNDPSFGSQWALYQASRRDIHATEAWDVETGSDTVIIAIIDTGVNYKHPDLVNNIWINSEEDIDGDKIVYDSTDFNGVDNDANGYTDDVIGYDFFTGGSLPVWPGEDGNVKDNNPNDFNGHGTHCAGIAAAVTHNGAGGAGIAGGWGKYLGDGGVQIMCLRAGYTANDGLGYVLTSAVVEAINYAARNGADVISYSAGSSNFTGMPQALNQAMDSGIVFCAAAGNENADNPDYFGLFDGILAVAATNRSDAKWSWGVGSGSNYGAWVEVSAPGNDIYSTYSDQYTPTYATLTGTSMAAPMVAGLAALIKSHYPQYDKTVIDTMIMNNADNIDAYNPTYIGLLGSGRINAYNCLHNAPKADFRADVRVGPAPLTVQFQDVSPAATSWSWAFGDGGVSGDQNPPPHVYTAPGLYNVSLEVTDPNGTDKEIKKYYIFATADTLTGDSTIIVPANGTDSVAITIYLKNTIPLDTFLLSFRYYAESGTANLDFKQRVSFEGTRGEDFDSAIIRAYAPTTDKVSIEFIPYRTTAKNPLMPGSGAVAKLWFSATGSGTIVFDTITLVGYKYSVKNRYVDYLPEYRPFRVKVGLRGDANADGAINMADAVAIVNFVFKGGPPPPTTYNGDANGDDTVNLADAIYLINYIFKGGPPPPP